MGFISFGGAIYLCTSLDGALLSSWHRLRWQQIRPVSKAMLMLNNITDYAIIRVTSSRGTLRYVPSYKEPAGNDDILESMPCRSVSEL